MDRELNLPRPATGVAQGVTVAFIALAAVGCGGGISKSSGSIARCLLTTADAVSGLDSVRLTSGTAAKTYALQGLSPTPTALDLTLPAGFVGSIQVAALARPAVGCMGYGGTGTALIAKVGDVATVSISMTPQDTCQVTGTGGTGGMGTGGTGGMGTGGTSGSGGTGTTGTGGTSGGAGAGGTTGTGGTSGGAGAGGTTGTGGASGGAGAGGTTGTGGASGGAGAGGTGGTSGGAGVGGTGGAAGTTGAGGMSGAAGSTSGAAGTGGTAGRGGTSGGGSGGGGGTGGASGGRGGTSGTGGTGGAAGTGGTGAAAGRGGSGGAAGQPSCSAAIGGHPATVPPPSLTHCTEYSQNDPTAACSTSTNANNPWINDVAVSPDGQYMATAGGHQLSQPTPTDEANDRVRIWRLVGSVPTSCGSIDISNPGAGPAYVAFSPNGQYLAVAWRADYVYIYSVPAFTMVGSILSSTYPLYGVGFSPDSQTVFSIEYDPNFNDGTLFADRPNGDPITLGQLGVDPDVLAVSPIAGTGNTATIAVGGYNGNAAVYTFDGTTISAPTVVNTGPAAAAWAVRFNPAGNLLAVGTDEGIVRFWNIPLVSSVPTGSSITANALSLVSALAFSPQGTHIAIGFDQEIDIYNVATRAFASRAGAADYVDAATFSASGSALISGENSCGRILICAD